MTTAPPTLADFLLARIAEEEAAASEVATLRVRREERSAVLTTSWSQPTPFLRSEGVVEDGTLIWQFGHDPTRVLAECEAKRRIVEMADESMDFANAMPAPGYARAYHSPSVDVLIRTQMLLALPYADHPDYDEAWRP